VIPINRHRIWQLVADGCLVALAWYLAFELRFDSGTPVFYETLFRRTILVVIGIKLAVFVIVGFYDRWWRYVSTRDMWRIVYGVGLATLLADVAVYLISPVPTVKLPRGLAAARADADGAPHARDRRARQGGARGGRGRRGPARDP
jgi:FlaA1/EpsC-like NDP-sugar epimerase